MKRYVRTLELVDDPVLIEQYLEAHRNIWPEITAGIRSVGIDRMDLYRLGRRLVMIIETADDVDIQAAFDRLATLPRQAEWEEYVGRFQQTAGGSSAEKWQDLDLFFEL